jgi:hypothetical protein
MKTEPLLREEEVSDGINVVIDNRWIAIFPMESRAQVNHLIESVNRAVEEIRCRS